MTATSTSAGSASTASRPNVTDQRAPSDRARDSSLSPMVKP